MVVECALVKCVVVSVRRLECVWWFSLCLSLSPSLSHTSPNLSPSLSLSHTSPNLTFARLVHARKGESRCAVAGVLADARDALGGPAARHALALVNFCNGGGCGLELGLGLGPWPPQPTFAVRVRFRV